MNKAVLLQKAWSQLPPEALSYRRLTDGAGRPTSRARKTLFTRIFTPETKYAVENSSSIDDPRIVDEVLRQVSTASPRLVRTVAWHRALRDAYYRMPAESRFFPDPVERLFAPAWLHAKDTLPDDADAARRRCDEIVAALRESEGALTSMSLARELADDDVVAAVAELVATAWSNRRDTLAAADAATERRILAAAALVAERIVPVDGVVPAAAEEEWQRLRTDDAVGSVLTRPRRDATGAPSGPRTYGLSNRDEPLAPTVRVDEWTESASGEAFAALDASLESRLRRVIAGDPHSEDSGAPPTMTALAALERAAGLVSRPLSLGSSAAHAVFLVATIAFSGLGAEKESRGSEAARGAARYLATRFRRSQGVTAVLQWPYGGFGSTVVDFVYDPITYALGRLWIRLSRCDFDEREPTTASAAWAHLRGATFSTEKHVHLLAKRIASRHVHARSLDDVLDTDAEPEALNPVDDDAAASPTDETVDMARHRESLRVVLRHIARVSGPRALEEFLAAPSDRSVDPARDIDAIERWETWTRGAAQERTRANGGQTTLAQEIAALPSYAQMRAGIGSRRRRSPRTTIPTGIGIHPVEPGEQGESRT